MQSVFCADMTNVDYVCSEDLEYFLDLLHKQGYTYIFVDASKSDVTDTYTVHYA